MEYWNRKRFVKDGRSSFHVYSGRHARITLVQIPFDEEAKKWSCPHGEVVVTVLIGEGNLETGSEKTEIGESESFVFEENENFRFQPRDADTNLVLQMVWVPGPNPCEICWESANRFFGEN